MPYQRSFSQQDEVIFFASQKKNFGLLCARYALPGPAAGLAAAAATRRPHAAPPASPAFCADCRLLGGFASCSSAATSQMFSLKCCERASRCFCWLINQQINDFYCRLVSSVLSQYVNRMKRKHNFISTDLYSE